MVGVWAERLAGDWIATGLATWCKMSSSLTLIALAYLAVKQLEQLDRRYAYLILAGMTLGTIGDFFNAGLLRMGPLRGTLGGIVAFGLGHLFYIAAISGRIIQHLKRSHQRGIDDSHHDTMQQNWWLDSFWMIAAIGCWQMVGLVSWLYIVYFGEKARELVWPALGYCLLLAGTTGIATALTGYVKSAAGLAIGAALFLLSDLLLAIGLFRWSFEWRSELVWLTYGFGQMLIVTSAWLVSTSHDAGRHQSGASKPELN